MANTRREIVEVHNEYRRLHGVPELKVDEHLAKEAQRWSGSLAQRGIAQYSNLQGYSTYSTVYNSDYQNQTNKTKTKETNTPKIPRKKKPNQTNKPNRK